MEDTLSIQTAKVEDTLTNETENSAQATALSIESIVKQMLKLDISNECDSNGSDAPTDLLPKGSVTEQSLLHVESTGVVHGELQLDDKTDLLEHGELVVGEISKLLVSSDRVSVNGETDCELGDVLHELEGAVREAAESYSTDRHSVSESEVIVESVELGTHADTSSVPSETQQLIPGSALSNQQKLLKRLEDEHIFPLKKKSVKFARAKFFCRLCEYHCDNEAVCERHITEPRHTRLMQLREANTRLRNLAPLLPEHKAALNEHLTQVIGQWAPSDAVIQQRLAAFQHMRAFILLIAPGAEVELYGSTASGFALTSSDINVNISCENSPKVLKDVLANLKTDTTGQYDAVVVDFASKVPSVQVRLTKYDMTCQLTVSCINAVQTSRYMACCARCDPRVRHLAVLFRAWAKLCGIDQQKNGCLPRFAYDIMTIFYLQNTSPPVLPVLHEIWRDRASRADLKKERSDEMYFDDIEHLSDIWQTKNTMSLAELWVGLLKFYCVDFDRDEYVIGVRHSKWLTRSSKQWASKKIAIEDPFQSKRNIAHSLSHHQVYEYVADRLRVAVQYYAVPPVKVTEQVFVFEFSATTLADDKGLTLMCATCQKQGHTDQNCPTDRLPDPEPLPGMTRQHHDLLDRILVKVPADFEPNVKDMAKRKQLMLELEDIVRTRYADAHLVLFGSSCNGFGFHDSDLDICLTFAKHPTPQGINSVEIIEELGRRLRKQRTFYNVLPIVTAKVPIVKFKHRPSQLDGDISLYNTLAQHNTRLLLTYCKLDPRVKILGYIIKVFAKMCDIGDASKGSLSSYAYVLMMIYFLQQRQPPVLPVLQELYPAGEEQPKVMVDGCNAWFFDDLTSLSKVWPHYGQNKESIAQLWVGLLCFYVEEFNVKEHVVCIRQHERLARFDKMWTGTNIAIEDPFDLTHDLGRGLTKRMSLYILRAFLNGRKHFGTPIAHLPAQYKTVEDYLFDPNQLTTGKPPDDNRCRRCGRIGHIAKDCSKPFDREEEDHGRHNAPHNQAPPINRGGKPVPPLFAVPPPNQRVPVQPVGNPKAPMQNVGNSRAPTQPVGNPRVSTQPVGNHGVPTQLVGNIRAPTQPVAIPRAPTQPVANPRAPTQPVGNPRAPTQPAGNPRAPTQPVGNPRAPTQPVGNPRAQPTNNLAAAQPVMGPPIQVGAYRLTTQPVNSTGPVRHVDNSRVQPHVQQGNFVQPPHDINNSRFSNNTYNAYDNSSSAYNPAPTSVRPSLQGQHQPAMVNPPAASTAADNIASSSGEHSSAGKKSKQGNRRRKKTAGGEVTSPDTAASAAAAADVEANSNNNCNTMLPPPASPLIPTVGLQFPHTPPPPLHMKSPFPQTPPPPLASFLHTPPPPQHSLNAFMHTPPHLMASYPSSSPVYGSPLSLASMPVAFSQPSHHMFASGVNGGVPVPAPPMLVSGVYAVSSSGELTACTGVGQVPHHNPAAPGTSPANNTSHVPQLYRF